MATQTPKNIISRIIQDEKETGGGSLLTDFANSLASNDKSKMTSRLRKADLEKKLTEQKKNEIFNRIDNEYKDQIGELYPGTFNDPDFDKKRKNDDLFYDKAVVDYKKPYLNKTNNKAQESYLTPDKKDQIIEKWKQNNPGCFIHIVIPFSDRHLRMYGTILNRFCEDNDIPCVFSTAFSIPNLKINEDMIKMRIILHKLFGKPDDHQNRLNYKRIVESINHIFKPKDKTLVETMGSDHLNIFLFDGIFTSKQEAMKLLSDRVYRRKCQFVDRKKKSTDVFIELTESIFFRMDSMNGKKKEKSKTDNKTVKLDLEKNRKRFMYTNNQPRQLNPASLNQTTQLPPQNIQQQPMYAPQSQYYPSNRSAPVPMMYNNQPPMGYYPNQMMYPEPRREQNEPLKNFDLYDALNPKKSKNFFKDFSDEEDEESEEEN